MANYRAALPALLVLFFALLHLATPSSVDRTLEKEEKGTAVVIATVNKIEASGIFENAGDFEFLRRVAAVEKNDGETAMHGGGGIWHVSMKVLEEVDKIITGSKSIARQIKESFCFDWKDTVGTDRSELDVPLYSALAVMLRLIVRKIPEDIPSQADLWTDVLNPSGDRQSFIDTAHSLRQKALDCRIKGVDMIFVMDESGSIEPSDFEKMREFAINLTDHFEIGPNRTQVGWINFDSSARVIFNLNTYGDKSILHQAIHAVPYSGGLTNIGAGLQALLEHGFVVMNGFRVTFEVPEVAIVVTDGQSDIEPIQEAAAKLRANRSIDVYVVGVGSRVNPVQLQAVALAGIATDIDDNIIHLDDFGGLNQLQETIRIQACSRAMVTATEVSHKELGGTRCVPQNVAIPVSTDCPPEGVTINACGSSGQTNFYISKMPNPSSALYDEMLMAHENECVDTFIECSNGNGRRRRQASEKIYMTIEGVGDENMYELRATTGDSSTPRVKLLCKRAREADGQGLIISCTSDRTLTEVLCSVNQSPFQHCTLPWRVSFVPPVRDYHLQINVVDSLNLTDMAIIEYQVGPLVLDCSLNEEMAIVCTSSNQLAPNRTVCSFSGNTADPCTLPHGIDVKGLPVGEHPIIVTATDVYGSTAQSSFEFLGQFWGRFTVGQLQTATPPATRRRELFDMTVFQQTELMKFSGFVHGSWESRQKMCLYSGDRQGFPLIQGTYTDYEMEKKLSTQYTFSEFDEDKCVPQDMGSGLSEVYGG